MFKPRNVVSQTSASLWFWFWFQTQQITPQLALQVLLQFDKAINTALANRVRNRVNFRVSVTPSMAARIRVWFWVCGHCPCRALWTRTGSVTTCGRLFWMTWSSGKWRTWWRWTRSRLSPAMGRVSRFNQFISVSPTKISFHFSLMSDGTPPLTRVSVLSEFFPATYPNQAQFQTGGGSTLIILRTWAKAPFKRLKQYFMWIQRVQIQHTGTHF